MTEIRSETGKFLNATQKFWNTTEKKSLKHSIFELHRQLYSDGNQEETTIIRQKFKRAFEGVIWCFQIISLLWVPDLSIKNWHKNMIFWEIIGYLKFDNTCSSLGIINECLYLSILITYASLFCMSVFLVAIYSSYSLPKSALGIFKEIFYLWSNLFLIPAIEIFSIFLKYSFFPQNIVSEYENNNDLGEFEISSALQVAIIFALLITLFLIFVQTVFSGEIRHFMTKKSINAKAHSKIDVHIIFFTFFFPMTYTVLARNSIIYLQILTIILAVFLIKETIIFLPYYSIYCNTAIILRFYFIAFISSLFILGNFMDNSLVVCILTIILGPISTYFAIQFSLKAQNKFSKSIPKNLVGINSQYNLEWSLRLALCSNDIENKDQIVHLFENFFREKGLNGNKLQAIWVANYCLFTLKDESLAKIKLSKIKYISKWSLEAAYQEYICSTNISNANLSEGSQYSNYFLQFNIIKKKDEILCSNLLNFWSEIASGKPNLHKLQKNLNLIDEEILFLNKEYSNLNTKFPNSREFLALYSSFIKDITYDSEKSILLEMKLRSLDRTHGNFISDSKNFSFFNDSNGILIISNELENFGDILYANQKSAEYFRLPISSLISDNILSFIHPYYKEKFKAEAKRFVQFTSSSEIILSQGFILITQNNILECVGKVSVTTVNDLVVAIFVFKPKVKNYEVALISEEGEIICHSDNFPRIARKNENLVGWNLKTLFFSSEDFELQPSTPYYLSHFKTETFLILSHSEFYKMKMPYIALINSHEELLNWNNENPQGNKEIAQITRSQLSINILGSLCSDKNFGSIDKESSHSEEDLDSKIMLYRFSDKNAEGSDKRDEDAKSQVSASTSQARFLNMIKSSSRSINVLHIAFVFSILTVLAVNITVLIYAFYNINFISDMNLPISIGKTGKNLQKIAYLSRMLFSLPNLPWEDPLYIDMAKEYIIILSNLENLYLNVTSNLNNWDSCSGQSILTDEVVNLWNVDENEIYKKKTTLISTIAKFIKVGNGLAQKFYTNETATSTDISFLLLNGYDEALHYCNSSLYDIIDCQKSMMSDFKVKMTILLLLGIVFLLACILIIIPFYYSIFKIENNLWNNIRKKAYNHYFELRQTVMERLKCVHSQPELALSDQRLSMKPFRFKNYWKYIWRTLVYLAFALLFSIINISYLYEKCTEYLLFRPEVLKNLINLQILYTSLSISTTEVILESIGIPLIYEFPSTYPFCNLKNDFLEIISKLGYSNSIIREDKYAAILSKDFKETLYVEGKQHDSNYFAFGVYSAELNIVVEASLVVSSSENPEIWLNLMSSIQELDSNYDTFIDEIDAYSQSVINDQMSIIVATLIIFIIFSFALYFGFYLVFFRSEKKYLQKINSVMEIMP
ncbi:unnamed protein product [Blepharisma stoltei]|uniref:TmcB/TmcC TPR repeats domain-containing protein n=1 Tax=Blepharisma stoltei TaxID=1481888 RepID=A0AAU9IJ32_9CILI|nr:unnamed protein product [Blepharisma stoltei]